MRSAIAGVLLLTGCYFSSEPSCAERACTALFAYVTVEVVDGNGAPVVGLSPVTTRLSTGEVVPVGQVLIETNVYTVIDDNYTALVDPDGEVFRFTAGGASADFTIGTDECSCHIAKLAGPERIVIP